LGSFRDVNTSVVESNTGDAWATPLAILARAVLGGEINLWAVDDPAQWLPPCQCCLAQPALAVVLAWARGRTPPGPRAWGILPWLKAWSRHTRVTINPADTDDCEWAVRAARESGRAALVVAADARRADAWAAALRRTVA
jgi:hypothetical protein